MGNLEVESKEPTSHELGDEEKSKVLSGGNTPHEDRNIDTPDKPHDLDNSLPVVVRQTILVDANAAVLSGDDSNDILNTELESEETVEEEEVHMLELVDPSPLLLVSDTTKIAFLGDGEVGVNTHHVRVEVVADDVLVVPRSERSSSDPIHSETANDTPSPRAVSERGVRTVMHAVKERESLAHTKDLGSEDTNQPALSLVIGQHEGEISTSEDEDEAGETRESSLGVFSSLFKVFSYTRTQLGIETIVFLVAGELSGLDRSNLILGEDGLDIVKSERVVRRKHIGDITTSREKKHLGTTGVLVDPFGDIVDLVFVVYPCRLGRVVFGDLLPGVGLLGGRTLGLGVRGHGEKVIDQG